MPDQLGENGTPFVWVMADDIESMDDLTVIDGRVYFLHGDGTCCPLLRQFVLADTIPGRPEPEVAATVYFGRTDQQ